jgi:hypothetical protein
MHMHAAVGSVRRILASLWEDVAQRRWCARRRSLGAPDLFLKSENPLKIGGDHSQILVVVMACGKKHKLE